MHEQVDGDVRRPVAELMAHRMTESVDAIDAVVRRCAGASASFGFTGGGHQVAKIVFDGKTRKQFFSTSPSDRHASNAAAARTRKILTELGAHIS